jgi:hypothetical protein
MDDTSVLSAPTVAESRALARVTDALRLRFPNVGDDQLADLVGRARQHYSGARVRDFVPVMVEREVVAALEDRV